MQLLSGYLGVGDQLKVDIDDLIVRDLIAEDDDGVALTGREIRSLASPRRFSESPKRRSMTECPTSSCSRR